MKAVFLVKNGKSSSAFEVREFSLPDPQANEVQIKVEAFGLNFADVMARNGQYPDAPKKPGILGYDVVGSIVKKGAEVSDTLKIGSRVIALTRFGGYAEMVNADHRGVVPIAENLAADVATALATQGGTAYYMAREMVNIFPGDHVLVHAAAGGVGSLLCQMALDMGATVFGTASTSDKLEFLKSIGVQYPINYKKQDFSKQIKSLLPGSKQVDVIFDAVGGKSVSKGFKLMGSGGRMVLFGASALTSAHFIWSKIGVALGFGIYSPIGLLNPSKSLIGVNMLRIADDNPNVIGRVIQGAVDLYNQGKIIPKGGGVYSINDIAQAHDDLEHRRSMGKLAIKW